MRRRIRNTAQRSADLLRGRQREVVVGRDGQVPQLPQRRFDFAAGVARSSPDPQTLRTRSHGQQNKLSKILFNGFQCEPIKCLVQWTASNHQTQHKLNYHYQETEVQQQ